MKLFRIKCLMRYLGEIVYHNDAVQSLLLILYSSCSSSRSTQTLFLPSMMSLLCDLDHFQSSLELKWFQYCNDDEIEEGDIMETEKESDMIEEKICV